MPYRRSYRRGRRTYRRYGAKRTGKSSNWGQMARTALRTAKFVAGLINVEKKFIDTAISTSIDNTSYRIFPLNIVAQGDDENQRNGRSILAKNLSIRGRLELSGSAVDFNTCRMVLVRDKANPGATVNMSDIYDTIVGNNAPHAFRNLLTGAAQRYDILWDKRITLDKDSKARTVIEKYIKLNNHIHYVGTGGTVADVGNGSLFLCVISTGTVAGDSFMTLAATARLRYIDN